MELLSLLGGTLKVLLLAGVSFVECACGGLVLFSPPCCCDRLLKYLKLLGLSFLSPVLYPLHCNCEQEVLSWSLSAQVLRNYEEEKVFRGEK